MSANAPYYNLRGQGFNNPQNTYEIENTVEQSNSAPDDSASVVNAYPDNQLLSQPLEQLANETQQQQQTEDESHSNLVELLEAANSAAGHEQRHPRRNLRNIRPTPDQLQGVKKRKRDAGYTLESEEGQLRPVGSGGLGENVLTTRSTTKTSRTSIEKRDGEDPGSSPTEAVNSALQSQARSEARAAGVHSAAALFRKPSSSTAKKYTRPPMSKLFMSLQLSPESFLHLQAAAKSYMLDPTYPERQECVGNRGKGDIDLVKLRLFNCVKEFLDDGVGEHFFGENVPAPSESDGLSAAAALGEESPGVRRWFWPRDATKVITLVTPLLRRMVTNERQRMYAVETRKGGIPETKDTTSRSKSTPEQSELREIIDDPESGHFSELDAFPIEPAARLRTEDHPLPKVESEIRIYVCKDNEEVLPRTDIPSLKPLTDAYSWKGIQDVAASRLIDIHVSAGTVTRPDERPGQRGGAHAVAASPSHGLEVVAAAAAAEADRQDQHRALVADSDINTDDPAHKNLQNGKGKTSTDIGSVDLASHAERPNFEIRVLTPKGLVRIKTEADWEQAKEEVSKSVLFESVMKVAIEIL